MYNFKDKVVVVTGSTKGIGRRIAEKFLEAGAKVAILGRTFNNNMLEDFAGGEGLERVFGKAIDVSNVSQLQGFLQNVIDKFGKIDILINNSGIYKPVSHLEVTEDMWDLSMSVNVKSYFFASQYFAKHVKQRGGKGIIVNIASINSQSVVKNSAAYVTSKAAVAMLTKSLALDWGELGIRVNAVGPGSVPTDINAKIYEDKAKLKALQDRLPLGRQGTKDEIANAVLFLASKEATYITGQILYVDGGWLLQ
ncbi:SDR family NAD(P)-dependent oxidoreductase [Clostridium sp. Mt-5]|uniref:SDR family NAD(P)-dependent oxidoreductase n=1 Tax=Clostridium moutaii TaxID=3240932 RepID=A0ABV4BN70_9CLOT